MEQAADVLATVPIRCKNGRAPINSGSANIVERIGTAPSTTGWVIGVGWMDRWMERRPEVEAQSLELVAQKRMLWFGQLPRCRSLGDTGPSQKPQRCEQSSNS